MASLNKPSKAELHRRRIMDSSDGTCEVSSPKKLPRLLPSIDTHVEDFSVDPDHNQNEMEERSDDEEPTESDNDFIDDDTVASAETESDFDESSIGSDVIGELQSMINDLAGEVASLKKQLSEVERRLRTQENSFCI